MPDLPAPRPPAPVVPLDRTAVERVLARAAELQAASAGSAADGLSEADLLEVAREAGLSLEHVRHALVEERLRAPAGAVVPAGMTPAAESGLALRLAGPAVAGSTRLLHGTPAQALDALARVLEREVCMTPVRRLADRGVWEPRRDLIGGVLRSLRGDTGLRMLRSTAGISAAAMAVDEGRTLVRVEADLAARRRQRLTAGTVATVTGALAGASAAGIGSLVVADAFTAILAPVAALPLAAGGAAAWLLARGHRQDVARVTEGLERLLDRVEAGAPPAAAPPGLLEMLDGVRRALG